MVRLNVKATINVVWALQRWMQYIYTYIHEKGNKKECGCTSLMLKYICLNIYIWVGELYTTWWWRKKKSCTVNRLMLFKGKKLYINIDICIIYIHMYINKLVKREESTRCNLTRRDLEMDLFCLSTILLNVRDVWLDIYFTSEFYIKKIIIIMMMMMMIIIDVWQLIININGEY